MSNLNEYSKEDLIVIVNRMNAGMSYDEAIDNILSNDMRNLVFKMHTAFCRTVNCGFEKGGEVYYDWVKETKNIIVESGCDILTIDKAVKYLLEIQVQKEEVLKALIHLLLKHVKTIDNQT
jgi:hypothetical protein